MNKALLAAAAALSVAAFASPAFSEDEGHWRGGRGESWEAGRDAGQNAHGGRDDDHPHVRHNDDYDRGARDGRHRDSPPPQPSEGPNTFNAAPPPRDPPHWDGDRHADSGRGGWDHGRAPQTDGRHDEDRRGADGDRSHWGQDDHGQPQGQWGDGRDRDKDGHWDNRNRDGDRHWDDRDWDRGEWRPYAFTHRDFYHPRYNDWRYIPRGRYFDDGYARILRGYFSYPYYWWDDPNWRRPYRPYRVGYVLPRGVYWRDLPYDLYYRLPRAPRGCRYVAVDHDVLLIVLATGLVLDALVYDDDDRRGYW